VTIYWILFALPLLGHLIQPQLSKSFDRILWRALGFICVLTIGFRVEVGCDWPGYLQLYKNFFASGDFGDLLLKNDPWFTLFNWDPGYVFLNWASAKLGFGIYGVNTICGLLIVLGLSAFCRKLPTPWLAWLIATPYFLTVVSMGYSRQAVAIGLFFWALSFAIEHRRGQFLLLVLAASLFHKSAIFLLVLGFLPYPLRLTPALLIVAVCTALVAIPVVPFLFNSYIFSSPYNSDGAFIRSLMNAAPALIVLPPIAYLISAVRHPPVFYWMAVASILSVLVVSFSTTVVDRAGLYLIPLQLYVLSVISSDRYSPNSYLRIAISSLIVMVYATVSFVWLIHAEHNECWLPYNNLLILYLFG